MNVNRPHHNVNQSPMTAARNPLDADRRIESFPLGNNLVQCSSGRPPRPEEEVQEFRDRSSNQVSQEVRRTQSASTLGAERRTAGNVSREVRSTQSTSTERRTAGNVSRELRSTQSTSALGAERRISENPLKTSSLQEDESS